MFMLPLGFLQILSCFAEESCTFFYSKREVVAHYLIVLSSKFKMLNRWDKEIFYKRSCFDYTGFFNNAACRCGRTVLQLQNYPDTCENWNRFGLKRTRRGAEAGFPLSLEILCYWSQNRAPSL